MNEGSVYFPRQVAVAALIGGPTAGCWLMRHNFRVLGKEKEARKIWIGGIAGTGTLLILCYIVPDKSPFEIALKSIPVVYTAVLHKYAEMWQGDDIRKHIEAGGVVGSWWAVVGIALVSLVVLLGLILIMVFSLPR